MKDFNEFSSKLNEETVDDNSITSVDDASGVDFKEPKTEEAEEVENDSSKETEEEPDTDTEEKSDSNDALSNMSKSLTTLFGSRDQMHYFHLQTESYAEHKALNGYYDSILDLTDELLEVYQGELGRIKGKIEITLEDYSEGAVMKHLDETLECIRDCRSNTESNGIINIYDDIESLILKTKYLITLK